MKIIGIPKEIKSQERRVALIPSDCEKLINKNFNVYIEASAGEGAGYDDHMYQAVGVHVKQSTKELYDVSQLIVKVKEPLEGDLQYLREDHLLFCYLHLAVDAKLVAALKNIKLTAVAFETVVEQGKTPLLAPMSAIAGRLAVQMGTRFLHIPLGGRGTLLGGFSDFKSGEVVVVGAGVAGTESATLAHNMGAHVSVVDVNEQRLSELKKQLPNITPVLSTPENLERLLKTADLLVGSVYVLGKRAPVVITEDMIRLMPKGSVAVDISIDQGGCIATSKPCTHENPTYVTHDVIHSCVTNMPAAAARTASEALSCVITPYVAQLAENDWSESLINGINVKDGELLISLT